MRDPIARRIDEGEDRIWRQWFHNVKSWRDLTKYEKEVIIKRLTKKRTVER